MRIFQGVTIGCIEKGERMAPFFDEDVYISTKASVLGGVLIGKGARIGAHALVLSDVLPNKTIVGLHKL